MYIKSITLHRLVAFQCAQINSLTLTCSDLIQVILGTNGSGKSSLLAQLAPTPAVSTDFLSDGWKELVIDHNGTTYRLVSDFRKKGPAHEFWCGDENLNEGGTTDVQKELVISHLGWTGDVEALCYNSFNFAGMGSTQREALFMKFNPDQIEFVLDKAKKTKSLIKATKIVLNRLLERKVQLESQLLPEDHRTTLKEEYTGLGEEVQALNKILYLIDRRLLDKHDFPQDDFTSVLREVEDRLMSARTVYRSEWNIDRSDPSKTLQDLTTQHGVISAEKSRITRMSEELAGKLRTLRDQIADYDHSVSEQALLSEIVSLSEQIGVITNQSIDHPFSDRVLDKGDVIINTLSEILGRFRDLGTPAIPRKKIALKRIAMERWSYKFNQLKMRFGEYEEKLDQVDRSLAVTRVDIPDQPCAKSKCPLYTSFMSQHTVLLDKRRDYNQMLQMLDRKLSHVSQFLEDLAIQISHLDQLSHLYDDLEGVTDAYPELGSYFRIDDIHHRLTTNPLGILRQITHVITCSAEMRKLPELKERVIRAELALEKHRAVTAQSLEHQKKHLTEQTTLLESYQSQLKVIDGQLRDVVLRIASVKRYLAAIRDIDTIQTTLHTSVAQQLVHWDRGKMIRIKQDLKHHLTGVQARLGEITQTLREQDGLTDRYNHEVLGQISENELLLTKLEWIKTGLEEIPRVRTLKFLNRVIKESNGYIRKVFTYDFKLDALSVDGSVNYKFPYHANQAGGPDIQKCSTAQKEITNLALTLTCRRLRGLTAYPLFLDEVGKTFDFAHQQKLLDLILYIVDEQKASQIFIVNHHAVIHDGLTNTETLVLHEANIMKTESYNTHAVIDRY